MMICSVCAYKSFETAVRSAQRRAVSASKMACDILHGMFDTQYLAMHTIAGGNSAKTAIDPALLQKIIGNYTLITHFQCHGASSHMVQRILVVLG